MQLNFVLSRRLVRTTGLLLACFAVSANAGTLDAPAAPDSSTSAMYTLTDLYNRLNEGTPGSKRSSVFVEPAAGPTAGTGHTLDEIMAKTPVRDGTNGAGVAEVLAGKTFWGLTSGAWGLQTGTATAGANVSGTNGSLSMTIPNGLYSGGRTATASDTNLSAGNIKTGVTIFGMAGTFTSDATAVPAEILSGKTAYVNGALVTGTVTAGNNVTGTSLSMTIPDGLYSGSKTATTSDGNLSAGNIKTGVTIFGTVGTFTNDGDAVAGNLLLGKKAYVNGMLVTGSIPTQTLSADSATVNAGYYAATMLNAVDTDLTAGNIKSGVTLFGVAGNYAGSSATFSAPFPAARTGDTTENNNNPKGVTWPTPRFTDNDNGTVTDNLTGLVWLKDANCDGAKGWAAAMAWVLTLKDDNTMCANTQLNDSSVAGQWRLPTIKELSSLVDAGKSNPALPSGHPFTGVQSNDYWSSTTSAANTSNAWIVYLYDGNVYAGDKASTVSVWPVRGGL